LPQFLVAHLGLPRAMDEKKTIINLIEQIVRSWLEEDYDFLNSCFDEHVVMCCSPPFSHSVGRKAVCEMMRTLHAGRSIKRFDQTDFTVTVVGNRSVAFYHYHMDYDENNAQHSESGVDFYVFEYREKEWRLCWRTVYTAENGSNDAFNAMLS
jgi:hypothetical protein